MFCARDGQMRLRSWRVPDAHRLRHDACILGQYHSRNCAPSFQPETALFPPMLRRMLGAHRDLPHTEAAWIAKPISHPRLREDVFRPAWVILDFHTQPPHVDPQILQFSAILGAPYSAQKRDMF